MTHAHWSVNLPGPSKQQRNNWSSDDRSGGKFLQAPILCQDLGSQDRGPRLDPNSISSAPDAVGHAWARTHARENARQNARKNVRIYEYIYTFTYHTRKKSQVWLETQGLQNKTRVCKNHHVSHPIDEICLIGRIWPKHRVSKENPRFCGWSRSNLGFIFKHVIFHGFGCLGYIYIYVPDILPDNVRNYVRIMSGWGSLEVKYVFMVKLTKTHTFPGSRYQHTSVCPIYKRCSHARSHDKP